MDPPLEHVATRAKNADQCPGEILKKRKRCTKVEIECDNALLQEKTQAEEQKKNEGIAYVAQLEDRMAVDDANIGSAHPRNHSGTLLSFT